MVHLIKDGEYITEVSNNTDIYTVYSVSKQNSKTS